MKPVLLLDVDGVLNVVGPDCERRLVRLPPAGHSFHPTPAVLPFLRWVWTRFSVVWTTAWRDSANEIADWAGLARMPALVETASYLARERRLARENGQKAMGAEEYLRRRGDWKLDAVREFMGRTRRPVFWLEDGISDFAHEWVASRPDTWYLASDSFEGVTASHAIILAHLSGLPGPGPLVETPKGALR